MIPTAVTAVPELQNAPAGTVVCRDIVLAPRWLRPIARRLASREVRALRALAGVAGVPAVLGWDGRRMVRSFLPGEPLHVARPVDAAYFRKALRLLRQVHARGIAHNDLAKEPNWLVLPGGAAGLIDFELACTDPRRGRIFRTLAREDLRHLLKHKHCYCPAQLTARQRRMLRQRSALARIWRTVVRPLFRALHLRRGNVGSAVMMPQS
jgi:RIO-like serine/threonine protein kinase